MSWLDGWWGQRRFGFDPEAIVARSPAERELIDRLRGYSHAMEYEPAVRDLLAHLDQHPDRDQFVLFAAATVLRGYLASGAGGALPPISARLLQDPRLDPVFVSCTRCDACWVPNPSTRGAFARHMVRVSSAPPGCPACGCPRTRDGRTPA